MDVNEGEGQGSKNISFVARVLSFLLFQKSNAFFAALRALQPLLFLKKSNLVIVTRYQDVVEALSQSASLRTTVAEKMDPAVGAFMLARDHSIENLRDKSVMRSVMRCDDITKVMQWVDESCCDIISQHRHLGEMDLVVAFSRRVPMLMAARYFGFSVEGPPSAELEVSMLRWARDTQHDMFFNRTDDDAIHRRSVVSGCEMRDYLRDLIACRQPLIDAGDSADDILSRLLRMRFDNGFDRECIVTNIAGMLVGTVETSSRAVVHIINELLLRPKILRAAKRVAESGDDSLLLKYCWEALRLRPLTPVLSRYCSDDISLTEGRKIKRGSRVLIAVQSAMQDRRELDSPRQFRIDRPDHHYLHMGHGEHLCLGEAIAKRMIPLMVRRLLLLPKLTAPTPPCCEEGVFPERYRLYFSRH